MSSGKLKRTLQRELTRNPAKTLTLLALLPVAGYFIVPLFWKPSSTSTTTPTPPSIALTVPASGAIATVEAEPLTRWQETATWIAQDMRTKPAHTDGLRNPFQTVIRPAEPTDTAEEETAKVNAPVQLRPEDYGLQLTATILGRTNRMATINGRLYPENSSIKVLPNGGAEIEADKDDAFVLKVVAKNYVMLEREGQLFRLSLAGNQQN